MQSQDHDHFRNVYFQYIISNIYYFQVEHKRYKNWTIFAVDYLWYTSVRPLQWTVYIGFKNQDCPSKRSFILYYLPILKLVRIQFYRHTLKWFDKTHDLYLRFIFILPFMVYTGLPADLKKLKRGLWIKMQNLRFQWTLIFTTLYLQGLRWDDYFSSLRDSTINVHFSFHLIIHVHVLILLQARSIYLRKCLPICQVKSSSGSPLQENTGIVTKPSR